MIIVMVSGRADGRYILCEFCTPTKRWVIANSMTAEQAVNWFYTEHLASHVEELVTWAADQVIRCRTCERIVTNDAPVHRPCFAVDCACECSRVPATTAPERTADAE